jgi:hypothetical protein
MRESPERLALLEEERDETLRCKGSLAARPRKTGGDPRGNHG